MQNANHRGINSSITTKNNVVQCTVSVSSIRDINLVAQLSPAKYLNLKFFFSELKCINISCLANHFSELGCNISFKTKFSLKDLGVHLLAITSSFVLRAFLN